MVQNNHNRSIETQTNEDENKSAKTEFVKNSIEKEHKFYSPS